jgi:hypothetical protein
LLRFLLSDTIGSVMPDLPEHEEQHIQAYVEGQWKSDEDPVNLVQRVGSERVLGVDYEMYDVHCQESRWWVITNPMNLYSQEDFPSVDQLLTFHVGLRIRMAQSSRTELDEDVQEHVSGAWRRYEQGVDAMNDASEAGDFQAVGIQCREALIALVQESSEEDWVGEVEHRPHRSDVTGWGEILAQKLTTGRMRTYLKDLFDTTWGLAVWLQHNTNATPWDAEFVLDATSHLIGSFGLLVHRHGLGAPERCPRCASYRVSEAFEEVDLPESGFTETPVCAACDWHGEPNFTSWVEKDKQISTYQKRKAQSAAAHEGSPSEAPDDGLRAARERDRQTD